MNQRENVRSSTGVWLSEVWGRGLCARMGPESTQGQILKDLQAETKTLGLTICAIGSHRTAGCVSCIWHQNGLRRDRILRLILWVSGWPISMPLGSDRPLWGCHLSAGGWTSVLGELCGTVWIAERHKERVGWWLTQLWNEPCFTQLGIFLSCTQL